MGMAWHGMTLHDMVFTDLASFSLLLLLWLYLRTMYEMFEYR